MKLHEYQAKQVLRKFGLPLFDGVVVEDAEDAFEASKKFQESILVVKAQVHAGGRGKAGGVKLVKKHSDIFGAAKEMLGKRLVTPQTGKEGVLVRKILIEPAVDIDKELYAAITLDRAQGLPVLMVSREGGVEIEELAKNHPEKILKIHFSPTTGLLAYQARDMAFQLGLSAATSLDLARVFQSLAKAFLELDASMVEINPLVIKPDGKVHVLDAKVSLDDNSLFRHPELAALRDPFEEDPREVEAAKWGFSYVGLDGTIGCMVNGAGLAMGTMDIIKFFGGSPANFLDVGGSATKEKVQEAFKLLLSDKSVKAILVNIFGGIMRCDIIAQGIIDALKEIKMTVPLVVRLEGTKVDEGKRLLKESGVKLIAASSLDEAAQKVVAASKQ